MRQSLFILTATGSLALCGSTNARELYLRDVPSPFGCTTCHQDPRLDRQNANIRNGFGFDYVLQQQQWADLCDLDSDRDGIPNKVELLDPDCLWRKAPTGQPNPPLPEGQATHPGDPNDPNQCGDHELQGRESCDGNELDGQDCISLGFDGGHLSCGSDCTFLTSECFHTATDMLAESKDVSVYDSADQRLDILPPTDSGPHALDAFFDAQADTDWRENVERDSSTFPTDSVVSTSMADDATFGETRTHPVPPTGCTSNGRSHTYTFLLWGALSLLLSRTRSKKRLNSRAP